MFTVQLALKTSSQATHSKKLKSAVQLNVIKNMRGGLAISDSKKKIQVVKRRGFEPR